MKDVLPETWCRAGSGVEVGGVPLERLAAEHGTPLYGVDEGHVRSRLQRFRAAFGPDATLVYAGKAFLCGALVRILDEAGWWVDAVSGGELELARRAGLDPGRVVLHGNAKSGPELEAAVRLGVGRVVVDHPGEIDALARVVDPAHPVRLLIRLNLDVRPDTFDKVKTVGAYAHFGMDAATAREAIAGLDDRPGLRLAGVHIHVGSQIRDLEVFHRAAAALVEFVEPVRDRFAGPPELDLGGGLGVAYVEGDVAPTPEAYAASIRDGLADAGAAERLGDHALWVEPGRSVIANAGITLYRVQAHKTVAGLGRVLAVDGGLSDNPRPSLYGARYEVLNASRPEETHDQPFRVVGRHCETGDVVAESARLPAATREGDLLVIPATGAYVYAMSSRYNGLGRPPVVFVAGGAARVAVRRETHEDLLACDASLGESPSRAAELRARA